MPDDHLRQELPRSYGCQTGYRKTHEYRDRRRHKAISHVAALGEPCAKILLRRLPKTHLIVKPCLQSWGQFKIRYFPRLEPGSAFPQGSFYLCWELPSATGLEIVHMLDSVLLTSHADSYPLPSS